MDYITLIQAKRQLKLSASESSDDQIIQDWITFSSKLIELWKGRVYYPYVKTVLYNSPINELSSFGTFDSFQSSALQQVYAPDKQILHLKNDLLEVIELLNGDGVEIDTFYLEPVSSYPKNRITLFKDAAGNTLRWLEDDNGNSLQAISLKALWGYVSNYPDCFVGSGDTTEDAPLLAADTEIDVNDADGVADDLQSPRFQAGQLLRLETGGNYEFLLCKSVNTTTNKLEVVRAQKGTTALVSVPQNTQIKIFRPNADIVQMCIRLTQWRYRQKDSDDFARTYNLGTGIISNPSALPADVKLILGERGKFKIS